MDKVFLFGEKKNIMGIVTEPDDSHAITDQPFVIILNSGLVHRPGPFRMNKDFSMLLSENGIASLRFDLSGVGDSEKQAMDSMLNKERSLSDVGEAITFIKDRLNPSKIIVMGLCTGADLAHRSAVKYPEISGSILLDGYGYPTRNFYIKRYAPILLSPKRMINLIGRIFKKIMPSGNNSDGQSESGANAYYWELPDKEDYISDMKLMFKDGKKHLYAYTSGVREYYNYEQQFVESFSEHSFCNSVQVNYFSYADHIYTLLEQRNKLFETTLEWIKKF